MNQSNWAATWWREKRLKKTKMQLWREYHLKNYREDKKYHLKGIITWKASQHSLLKQ